jgi:hypothetical protein
MAQLTGVGQTYQDKTRREDLMDRIADISPDMNYLTTILSSVPVDGTFHEWTEYNISRDSSNSTTAEGDENSFSDLTGVTRLNNITQVIKKVFSVSGTNEVVNRAGPKAAYAREMGWAMKRAKNSWEYATLRGTKASGSSGVAREMNGFIAEVITNGLTTARNSGTSMSEQEFRDINLGSWNATDEYLIDLILSNGFTKQSFGKFFTSSTPKTIAADDKRLVQALDVIENDFSQLVEIRAHKDMPAGAMLGIRKSLCHTGVLRPFKHVPNGVTGDNIKGHIVGEMTSQIDSSRAMMYRSGYLTS